MLKLIYLSSVIVIAEKANPWAAIKLSFEATRSHFWALLGLIFINVVIIFAAIATVIGLIWAIPYVFINYGIIYNKLISGSR